MDISVSILPKQQKPTITKREQSQISEEDSQTERFTKRSKPPNELFCTYNNFSLFDHFKKRPPYHSIDAGVQT